MWRHLWRHYDVICESSNQMPERLHHTHVTCASLLIGCAPLPHSKNSYFPSYPYPLKASSPNSIPYPETEWQFLLPHTPPLSKSHVPVTLRLVSQFTQIICFSQNFHTTLLKKVDSKKLESLHNTTLLFWTFSLTISVMKSLYFLSLTITMTPL